jgi:hypothetical protein
MKSKTVLKFDTGRDGFEKMILVLGVMSIVVLICGIYFLVVVF